ncbi:MAG: tRNA 2-selenouridine(34) synthase MnmH [Pseudomonadota bacterium]
MTFELTTLRDLSSAAFDTIIDVRAPSEFALDHVPGAMNLPVLSDAERAEVGTLYKQVDKFEARKRGAALVARNAADHIDGTLRQRPGGWRPLIYCWRGGQRSESFAAILSRIGWRVEVLSGGYRSYRRRVAAVVHDQPIAPQVIVLDGNTGTAKTAFLQRLRARGHQTLDLEAAAGHRGSVFGHLPEGQPSQKAFEGRLAMQLSAMDAVRPVVVEAESSKIGNVQIPPSLWAAMILAPRIRLNVPLSARAGYLVEAYGDVTADPVALNATLDALRPHQGAARIEAWQAMVATGAFGALAAELMEAHYDPRYAKSRMRRSTGRVVDVHVAVLDDEGLAHGAEQIEAALRSLSAV